MYYPEVFDLIATFSKLLDSKIYSSNESKIKTNFSNSKIRKIKEGFTKDVFWIVKEYEKEIEAVSFALSLSYSIKEIEVFENYCKLLMRKQFLELIAFFGKFVNEDISEIEKEVGKIYEEMEKIREENVSLDKSFSDMEKFLDDSFGKLLAENKAF